MEARGVPVSGQEPGGLSARGSLEDLYRLNLHLRTASRVLVRLAHFRAASFQELEARADRVPWGEVLGAGVRPTFQVTCRKSRLYHSGAVEERLLRAAAAAAPGGAPGSRTAPAGDPAGLPEQRFVVRLVRNRLTLSADASGENLHRRGYREATARAPLRETLAAAVLLACGWTPDQALVDPLCGSGTLAIEAALLARGIPPGWRRGFAFGRWPGFDPGAWARVRAEAEAGMRSRTPAPVVAADRDAGAVRAASENAARAGVADDLTVRQAALSHAAPPDGWHGRGWLATNPPWGRRVGGEGDLRNLYARLGQVARERFPGWGLAVLTSSPVLAGQVDPALRELLATKSGNVAVRLWTRA